MWLHYLYNIRLQVLLLDYLPFELILRELLTWDYKFYERRNCVLMWDESSWGEKAKAAEEKRKYESKQRWFYGHR